MQWTASMKTSLCAAVVFLATAACGSSYGIENPEVTGEPGSSAKKPPAPADGATTNAPTTGANGTTTPSAPSPPATGQTTHVVKLSGKGTRSCAPSLETFGVECTLPLSDLIVDPPLPAGAKLEDFVQGTATTSPGGIIDAIDGLDVTTPNQGGCLTSITIGTTMKFGVHAPNLAGSGGICIPDSAELMSELTKGLKATVAHGAYYPQGPNGQRLDVEVDIDLAIQ